MIAVECSCRYRSQVPARFTGQNVKCPQCGNDLVVGGLTPSPRPSPAFVQTPESERVGVCPSCARVLAPKEKLCSACGYDQRDLQRKCLKCKMPIVHDDGPGFGGALGIASAITGVILFRLIGILGVAGVVLFLACLNGIGTVMKMRWRCGGCDADVPPGLLSHDETSYHRKRRWMFVLITVGLGAASLACFGIWAALAAAVSGR